MGTSTLPPPPKRTPAASPEPVKRQAGLADIRTKPDVMLPNRYGIIGPAGTGKTTLGAYSVKPIFLMPRGETGLLTLINAGRLPEIPHFPEAQSWDELLGYLRVLRRENHEYRTLVVDTINTAENLLHEHVCETQFNGDWSKTGFLSFNAGYEVSLGPLREMLVLLDALRSEKRMMILLLGHTRIKTFKNPEGADYDRYQPDIHEKSWSLVDRWLDTVLFLNYETIVTQVQESGKQKKGKAIGGSRRFAYTERTAAYDAKNRLGLPKQIDLGDVAEEAWGQLTVAVREARRTSLLARDKAAKGPEQAEPQQQTEEEKERQ